MNYVYAPYLPKGKVKRRDWFLDFAATLPSWAEHLEIGAEVIEELQLRAQWLIYGRELQDFADRLVRTSAVFSDSLDTGPDLRPVQAPLFAMPALPDPACGIGSLTWAIALVDTVILTSPHLNEVVLTVLKLHALPEARPVEPRIFEVKVLASGLIELNFSRGAARLIHIEAQRGAGEWELVDKVVGTRWHDRRPNLSAEAHESRAYRIRFSNGAQPYGDYSPAKATSTWI